MLCILKKEENYYKIDFFVLKCIGYMNFQRGKKAYLSEECDFSLIVFVMLNWNNEA